VAVNWINSMPKRRKKPGPAPRSPAKKKSALLQLRATPAEKRELNRASELAGETFSSWALRVLLEAARAQQEQ
jgi:uncharacterized protein (DUF1778 family)